MLVKTQHIFKHLPYLFTEGCALTVSDDEQNVPNYDYNRSSLIRETRHCVWDGSYCMGRHQCMCENTPI